MSCQAYDFLLALWHADMSAPGLVILVRIVSPLWLAVENVKAAYRISYSLFDKVSFFMNAYMELGIPEAQVSFRRLWRTDEKKPIRKEFDSTDNWAFCALYWLAKDFFEKANDEVAEPQARGLCEIRNHLEHKYLRVTIAGSRWHHLPTWRLWCLASSLRVRPFTF